MPKEKEDKASLQAEVQHLREDNLRLQEESQNATEKLKKFTEWVFNTIDMNWKRCMGKETICYEYYYWDLSFNATLIMTCESIVRAIPCSSSSNNPFFASLRALRTIADQQSMSAFCRKNKVNNFKKVK